MAEPKTLINMTCVHQNETIDKERTGVFSGKTTTNMEKDATTFEPKTNIRMSYKIMNRTDLNTGASGDYNDDIKWYELLNGKQGKRDSHVYRGPLAAPTGRGPLMTNTNAVNSYRLSQGTLNIRKRDVSDTSESASEIYIEDVLLEKQLTNKREERDTYVFQASPTHAAGQGQKAAEIEMSCTKFASLLDAVETRKENETNTTLETSDDNNDDVAWRDPPGCAPEESEVKDYEFVPEEGQELYLTPTNI